MWSLSLKYGGQNSWVIGSIIVWLEAKHEYTEFPGQMFVKCGQRVTVYPASLLGSLASITYMWQCSASPYPQGTNCQEENESPFLDMKIFRSSTSCRLCNKGFRVRNSIGNQQTSALQYIISCSFMHQETQRIWQEALHFSAVSTVFWS